MVTVNQGVGGVRGWLCRHVLDPKLAVLGPLARGEDRVQDVIRLFPGSIRKYSILSSISLYQATPKVIRES